MKKLLLMLVVFASIGFAQNIPVTTGSTNFYADSISQEIDLSKSLFLGGVYMPKSRTDTLWFQVSDGTSWFWLTNSDKTKYIVVSDSTTACYLPLKPTVLYPAKKLRILFNADIADTLSISYDARVY